MSTISTEIKREHATPETSPPHYTESTLAAMEEARRISRDPSVPSYDNLEDLKKALGNH